MKKKKIKSQNKRSKLKGIKGWLLAVLIAFIFSALIALYLFFQRLKILTSVDSTKPGVWISLVIILIYLLLLIPSIYLIINKKKIAIKTSQKALIAGIIFILWYQVIGVLIFYNFQIFVNNFQTAIINLALSVAIILYFKKSKRVKNTLVR